MGDEASDLRVIEACLGEETTVHRIPAVPKPESLMRSSSLRGFTPDARRVFLLETPDASFWPGIRRCARARLGRDQRPQHGDREERSDRLPLPRQRGDDQQPDEEMREEAANDRARRTPKREEGLAVDLGVEGRPWKHGPL